MADNDGCPDRRTVLKTIGVGAVGATGVSGVTGSAAADHDGVHFSNPTYPDRVFADPTLIRVEDTYYAYASNMAMEPESEEELIPIAESQDLVDWSYVGEAMEQKPD